MIALVPFGAAPKALLEFLSEELAYRFGEEVQAVGPEPLPEGAFDPKRNQYRSSLFLRRQDEDRQEIERRIGIVDVDLYHPEFNFVFGEADPVDRVAVVSVARLHAEAEEEARFRARALKEAVHEIGHTYHLDHCDNPKCVMHFSNTLDDVDRKSADFCMTHQAELKRRS